MNTNMQEILQENVLRISLHVRKCKTSATVTPAYLGIKAKTSDTEEFISKRIKGSCFIYFPKHIMDKLETAGKKMRQILKRKSLAYETNVYYINMKDYAMIKDKYQKARNDYMAIKDDIISNYDVYYELFKKEATAFLSERKVDAKYLSNILSDFPSKIEIENDFVFDLSTQPYPVFNNTINCSNQSLVTDMIKSSEKEAVALYKNMVTTLMAQSFEKINNLIDQFYETKSLSSRTKTGINNLIQTIEKNKSWLGNKDVDMLYDMLKQAIVRGQSLMADEYGEFPALDGDQAIEQLEMVLAFIYNRCKIMHTEEALPFDKEYNGSYLNILYSQKPIDKHFKKYEEKTTA